MPTPIVIDSLDHLVLTVRDLERTCEFYQTVLGMRREEHLPGRLSLHFGEQKLNLHPFAQVPDPNVRHPTPGSADLCFLTRTPLDEVRRHLKQMGIPTIGEPSERVGAKGRLLSIYLYDPDENLIEISNVLSASTRA